MTDLETLRWLVAQFGVGGALALGMLALYRRDVLTSAKRTEAREDAYIALLVSNTKVNEKVIAGLERQAITNEKVEHAVNNFVDYLRARA